MCICDDAKVTIIHEVSIAIKPEDANQTLPKSSKRKKAEETASLSNDPDGVVVVRFGQHATALSGKADYLVLAKTKTHGKTGTTERTSSINLSPPKQWHNII